MADDETLAEAAAQETASERDTVRVRLAEPSHVNEVRVYLNDDPEPTVIDRDGTEVAKADLDSLQSAAAAVGVQLDVEGD